MKHVFEEAAELFRQNQRTEEGEKARLYQGLALLADGLQKLERRFEQIEAEAQNAVFKGARKRVRTRIIVAPPAP